jgi:hypothetical protein
MPEHMPERDWKLWQRLAPRLLNRFCNAAAAKAAEFSMSDASGHEKFLALYRFISETNGDIAVVFDDRRRSSAILQIGAAVARGIMSEAELNSFSEETQERVRTVVAIGD